MRDAFPWYFPPSKAEIEDIWNRAHLTVDTNVLLDLYRYNPETRDDVLKSLHEFTGRTWLTRQVADEFIRHRYSVIIELRKTHDSAIQELNQIADAINNGSDRIVGTRLFPVDLVNALRTKAENVISEFREQVKKSKDGCQVFRDPNSDLVLASIAKLFPEIGPPVSVETLSSRKQEAERRINECIPPGYLDKSKPEPERFGDYLLWTEVLERAKERECPVVLVTSENKEDWWEKVSGEKTGPRQELLKESFEFSGQRVIIYQTLQFLNIVGEVHGRPLKPKVLTEVKGIQEKNLSGHYKPRSDLGELNSRIQLAFGARNFERALEACERALTIVPSSRRYKKLYAKACRAMAGRLKFNGDQSGAQEFILKAIGALASIPASRRKVSNAETMMQLSMAHSLAAEIFNQPAFKDSAMREALSAVQILPCVATERWLSTLRKKK